MELKKLEYDLTVCKGETILRFHLKKIFNSISLFLGRPNLT